jgi:hypothetical protein
MGRKHSTDFEALQAPQLQTMSSEYPHMLISIIQEVEERWKKYIVEFEQRKGRPSPCLCSLGCGAPTAACFAQVGSWLFAKRTHMLVNRLNALRYRFKAIFAAGNSNFRNCKAALPALLQMLVDAVDIQR